jgi:hypothetical protein
MGCFLFLVLAFVIFIGGITISNNAKDVNIKVGNMNIIDIKKKGDQ